MQPTPVRLSQAIWTAFRAAKPTHSKPCQYLQCSRRPQLFAPPLTLWPQSKTISSRFYSEDKKHKNVEEKVQDVKDRIHDSLESRAEQAAQVEPTLKHSQDETIVHTLPESASIVYNKDEPTKRSDPGSATNQSSHSTPPSDMPSQIAALRSKASKRFLHFMDNMQSQLFVASKRINDLTGYTGIERLKRDIEAQEQNVQNTRKLVKANRAKYSASIATRSATQREVNDLLHRKHTWTPSDLERFTSLYSVDHANEQAEHKAQQELGDAEAQYEEASTKLARSILARYHEEQIWSDKIRQMSTWGTWGLMGLNILLFVVLQLAIEPWRRRRLVRGFEDKVAAALASTSPTVATDNAATLGEKPADQLIQEASEKQTDGLVAMAGEKIAETVVDAVSGSTNESETTSEALGTAEIESAVEEITSQELAAESQLTDTTAQLTGSTTDDELPGIGSPDVLPIPDNDAESTQPSWSFSSSSKPFTGTSAWTQLPSLIRAFVVQNYTHYYRLLLEQFNEKDHVVLSRKELTTRILEGVAIGAATAGGILFVFAANRVR